MTTLLLLIAAMLAAPVKSSVLVEYQYMAICTDGDGALTAWLDTRQAANDVGKAHEVATKGHRWVILERQSRVRWARRRRRCQE